MRLVSFVSLGSEGGRPAREYRTKFSKRTLTQQPQLLAVLCLMRYEHWTRRKTEVRLAEHGELRSALGLRKALDYPHTLPFP
jgi:hypothetical protein